MSILAEVARKGSNKFVIPCAGKMFHSNISKTDKALCFIFNKGYLETSDLMSMLSLLDDLKQVKSVFLVGQTDKIKLTDTGNLVYRQRVFFKSLVTVLSFCKAMGLKFELAEDFQITINNVMNCLDDLVYLERYARYHGDSIDVWLKHCCKIELYFMLRSMNIYSDLYKSVNRFLRNKTNYLYRAPFLISSYNIDEKSSGIFLGFEVKDKRLYEAEVTGKDLLQYGYTKLNVEKDIKEGRL